MRKIFLGIFAILFFWNSTSAAEFPEFENFVTDTTGTLATEMIAELNSKLANYESETGTEIAIAIVDSTDGMPIEQFATALGNEWGIGKSQIDNGAILVVAKSDRELFLATGSQLEGALTDLEAAEIVDEIISPRFANGDFDDGIAAGVDGILAAVNGESFSDLRMGNSNSNSPENFANAIFILLFFILPWLAAIFGRSKRIWPGGAAGAIAGGVGGAVLLGGILGIVGAALGLGIFGLIFDAAVSRNYAAAGRRGRVAWWAGGGRGNFRGGGGFGGFGGGGFSGGGAGGSW